LHSGQPGQVQVDLGLAGVVTGLLEQVQGAQAVRARVVKLLEAWTGPSSRTRTIAPRVARENAP
jgi:ATP phosphoribosyltransferase regulatory subunit HisZ